MGGGSGFLTNRGTANVLTRATATLAAIFFATSLFLSWYAGLDRKPGSILGTGAPAPTAPGTPSPLGGAGGGGLLDTLRAGDRPAGVPVTPSGPQVPQSQ